MKGTRIIAGRPHRIIDYADKSFLRPKPVWNEVLLWAMFFIGVGSALLSIYLMVPR